MSDDLIAKVGSLFTRRWVDEHGDRCTQRGGSPDCKHTRTRDRGRGTVCIFQDCVDCGADLTISCGDDPFLRDRE